jgi:hypothetical protein
MSPGSDDAGIRRRGTISGDYEGALVEITFFGRRE